MKRRNTGLPPPPPARSWWWIEAVVAVIAGLIATLSLPVFADSAARDVVGITDTQEANREFGALTDGLGLRSLPLIDPAGPVQSAFGDGTWQASATTAREALTEVAASGGLTEFLDGLLLPMGNVGDPWWASESVRAHPERWYPGVRSDVAQALSPQDVSAKRESLNELAAALLLTAASTSTYNDWGKDPGGLEGSPESWYGTGALVIWDRLRSDRSDCASELNYALTLSWGSCRRGPPWSRP